MKRRITIACAAVLLVAAFAVGALVLRAPEAGGAPSNPVKPFNISSSKMRIENEDKLDVPSHRVEEVWSYLVDRLVNDKAFLKSLDPDLDSYWNDELFTDVYFDTPDLAMLARQSGIRHRTRANLTDPGNKKDGRELVQIKLSGIDDNVLNRGELKFAVDRPSSFKKTDDVHPVLGIIKRSKRPEFKELMTQLGVDPYSLKEVLVLKQRRRSFYITRNGGQFISIRLDECSSKVAWAQWEHVELEPELNETPYTDGTDAYRAYMEGINSKIVDDIMERFPEIRRDLTPKYNKAFGHFESQIPYLRFLVRHNLL